MDDAGALPDRRLNAFRPDLADARLRQHVTAERYISPRPARIVGGLVPVRPAPDPAAAIDTYFTHGEPVALFDNAAGWAWCQSGDDGYVGYVPAEAVGGAVPTAGQAHVANMLAFVFAGPDLKTGVIDVLPRHARVALADRPAIVTRNTLYRALEGDGFVAQAAICDSPPRSTGLLAAARRYLGAPYLWAGKSFGGIDCSGLVQRAFQDIGRAVPRDSDMQQAHFPDAVTLRSSADLQPGDLVFGRGHVGIATGGAILHAEGTRHMCVLEQPSEDFFAEVFDGEVAAATVRRP